MPKITLRGINPMKSMKYMAVFYGLVGLLYGLIAGLFIMVVNIGLALMTIIGGLVVGAIGGAIMGYLFALIINFALEKSDGFDIRYDMGGK